MHRTDLTPRSKSDLLETRGWVSILEEIAIELHEKLGRGGVLITVFDGEDDILLVSVDRTSTSDARVKRNPALWLSKEIIEIKRKLVIDNVVTHPLCQRILPQRRFPLGAYIGMPVITTDGLTIGSAGAYFSTAHRWSDPEIELIGAMAKRVLAALEGGATGSV